MPNREELVQFVSEKYPNDPREIGEPALHHEATGENFCPKCLSPVDGEVGYGLAFGHGLGTYWICPNDDCDWFYKFLDVEEA